jgi:hypothetical protein
MRAKVTFFIRSNSVLSGTVHTIVLFTFVQTIDMKQLLTLLSVFALATCISCTYTEGSGNTITENRKVEAFSKLRVNGSMDVTFTQSDVSSVTVKADDNIIELIETEVKDGELVIGFKPNVGSVNNTHIEVLVSAKLMEELGVHGSGSITTTNKITPPNELKITVVGSGDIDVTVNAPVVRTKVTGSGTVDVKGECANHEIALSGSGDVNAADLLGEKASIELNGSGNVNVFADVQLTVSVNGSGDVRYKGKCSVNSTKNGSGSIEPM